MRNLTKEEIGKLKEVEEILKDVTSTEVESNQPLKIVKLCLSAVQEVIEGNGNKKIFIADDNGSTFHALRHVLDANPDYATMCYVKEYSPDMKDVPVDEICLID